MIAKWAFQDLVQFQNRLRYKALLLPDLAYICPTNPTALSAESSSLPSYCCTHDSQLVRERERSSTSSDWICRCCSTCKWPVGSKSDIGHCSQEWGWQHTPACVCVHERDRDSTVTNYASWKGNAFHTCVYKPEVHCCTRSHRFCRKSSDWKIFLYLGKAWQNAMKSACDKQWE